ncbi:hypothetical protein KLP38_28495 (plasmid) [Cupriavidus sp. EM10]|nr:hypothetical protein KLP38_28495 [Cupriavidus sp. EM10]
MGDWHTHPNGVPQMGWLDRRTLRAIARHPDANTQRPLMLIGGGPDGNWNWPAHRYRYERLLGPSSASDLAELRVFRDNANNDGD